MIFVLVQYRGWMYLLRILFQLSASFEIAFGGVLCQKEKYDCEFQCSKNNEEMKMPTVNGADEGRGDWAESDGMI